MVDTQLLIILFINFLLLVTLVVLLIRFAAKKFKEQQDDVKDRLTDIEEKYTKLDVQFSRVLALHVSQQSNVVNSQEKIKHIISNTNKSAHKKKNN